MRAYRREREREETITTAIESRWGYLCFHALRERQFSNKCPRKITRQRTKASSLRLTVENTHTNRTCTHTYTGPRRTQARQESRQDARPYTTRGVKRQEQASLTVQLPLEVLHGRQIFRSLPHLRAPQSIIRPALRRKPRSSRRRRPGRGRGRGRESVRVSRGIQRRLLPLPRPLLACRSRRRRRR